MGDDTCVPISWACKQQSAVSHSSTETEVIPLDAFLQRRGTCVDIVACWWLTCLNFLSFQQEETPRVSSQNETSKDILESIDYVPPNAPGSSNRAHLVFYHHCAADIKMIVKGRSPHTCCLLLHAVVSALRRDTSRFSSGKRTRADSWNQRPKPTIVKRRQRSEHREQTYKAADQREAHCLFVRRNVVVRDTIALHGAIPAWAQAGTSVTPCGVTICFLSRKGEAGSTIPTNAAKIRCESVLRGRILENNRYVNSSGQDRKATPSWKMDCNGLQ